VTARGPVLILALVVCLLVALGTFQIARGVPAPTVTITQPATTTLGQPIALPMPATGASIVAVEGLGTLAEGGSQAPRPMASVTKVMTAYLILKERPLTPGAAGPTITITARDQARYFEFILQDATALPVVAGQQLTQYQLLQGLLIPSANNFAEIMAVWNAGSVPAFLAKMNAEAQALGMRSTTYADPSGLSASSVTTPADQLVLVQLAMKDAVFREIVGMRQATIPGVGTVTNVNMLLGQEGVIGVKTGFTEEAGGNLAFAAQRQAGGRQVNVYGVVLGQDTRPLAFEATRLIVSAVGRGLQVTSVVRAGLQVGTISTEWGEEVAIVTDRDVEMLSWPGMTLETRVEMGEVSAPLEAGAEVGVLHVKLGSQEERLPLYVADELAGAGIGWRLTRR
jgi:D-alanyl-D-alanine carboxypeptidase (penicillin-binding protein 5/6)